MAGWIKFKLAEKKTIFEIIEKVESGATN